MDISKKLIKICNKIINWLPFASCHLRMHRNSNAETNLLLNEENVGDEDHLVELESFVTPALEMIKTGDDKTGSPLQNLNTDILFQVLSFLNTDELTTVTSTCKKLYNLRNEEQFLRAYAIHRYGIFFSEKEQSPKLLEVIKVMNDFYRAWNQLTPVDKQGLQHNLNPAVEQAFKSSFKKFKELSNNDYKWTSVYLAVMYHYGFGTEPSHIEVKEHLDKLKEIWISALPASFKRKDTINLLARVVLTHFNESVNKNASDRIFYDRHLSSSPS